MGSSRTVWALAEARRSLQAASEAHSLFHLRRQSPQSYSERDFLEHLLDVTHHHTAPTMSSIDEKVFFIKRGSAYMTLDSRYFPLLFIGIMGSMTAEMLDEYYVNRRPLTDKARATGTKIILVIDSSRMEVPTATMRKYVADRMLDEDTQAGCILEYINIIPNSLMRGVATALAWMAGDKGAPSRNVGTMDAAINTAMKSYASHSLSCPKPPADYQVPGPQ